MGQGRFTAEDGSVWSVGPQLAYRGEQGCTDPRCTQIGALADSCYGWHCPRCHAPCSMMGHDCEQTTNSEHPDHSETPNPAKSKAPGGVEDDPLRHGSGTTQYD